MTQLPTTSVPPVEFEITVRAPREHAFIVFTERFDSWWPRSHHTGSAPPAQVRVEGRAGGRWYEIGDDGTQGEWGSVLEWEPPARVVLAWQLDADFRYDPDLITRVTVTFEELAPDRTRVRLEHGDLERYGVRAHEIRDTFNQAGGWRSILAAYISITDHTSPTASEGDPMTVRTSPWPAGVPCWTDLATTDVDGAIAFYSGVLGWTCTPPFEEFGGYSIAQVEGHAAAGIGRAMSADQPTAWTLYFASDDVEKTAAAIGEQGGTVLMPPGDVGTLGRLLVAADPGGGVFGCWQALDHIGAEHVNAPGGMIWEDLRSTDPAACFDFYSGVFGLVTTPLEMAGPTYRTFAPAGEASMPMGGIGGMMGAEGSSHWLVYFGSADTDAAVAAAQAGGGTIAQPAFDSPFGRMATIKDPQGATFAVIQPPEGMPRPDRAG